ncbi:MAG: hypothetical protein CL570_04505 [Alphaproteobacteria bacterium]|nr:hypothetical protein [Alphaproteobacteria bacterium]HCQ71734.1 hypothetical protein [Rhodospirillaceae bacterium]|tara:strand:- start:10435 stop:11487 length:1053 start_codon:yes stop_codon:yes gene_type:complete
MEDNTQQKTVAMQVSMPSKSQPTLGAAAIVRAANDSDPKVYVLSLDGRDIQTPEQAYAVLLTALSPFEPNAQVHVAKSKIRNLLNEPRAPHASISEGLTGASGSKSSDMKLAKDLAWYAKYNSTPTLHRMASDQGLSVINVNESGLDEALFAQAQAFLQGPSSASSIVKTSYLSEINRKNKPSYGDPISSPLAQAWGDASYHSKEEYMGYAAVVKLAGKPPYILAQRVKKTSGINGSTAAEGLGIALLCKHVREQFNEKAISIAMTCDNTSTISALVGYGQGDHWRLNCLDSAHISSLFAVENLHVQWANKRTDDRVGIADEVAWHMRKGNEDIARNIAKEHNYPIFIQS